MNEHWLVADIGGTNARFALSDASGCLKAVQVLSCADYPDIVSAMRAYLENTGAQVRHAAVAIANPIVGDSIQMTNHHWAFSIEAVRQALHWDTLLFINDFTAQALSIPLALPAELAQVGGAAPQEHAPKAVIGPGTGLGVSGLVHSAAGYVAISGEGGHVSFSPTTEEEIGIWRFAKERFGHVSAERLLSGAGLELIHEALTGQMLSAADISARAMQKDAACVASLDRFCAILGACAGNLALTLGAHGGVYVVGGIIPRILQFFQASSFRGSFDAKGRMGRYLETVPVFVVLGAYPGLEGAKVALAQHLARQGCLKES